MNKRGVNILITNYVKKTIIVNGLSFEIRSDTSDSIIVEDNILKHPYEKKFPVLKDEYWLEVGGHIGSFAIRAMSVGAKVFSFEADPTHCEMYRKNCQLNAMPCNLIQSAIMYKPIGETLDFYLNTHRGGFGGNSIYQRWKKPRPIVRVPCLSFDGAFEAAKKVIGEGDWNLKLDCEGAEVEILENFKPDFKKVALEYHFCAFPSVNRLRKIENHLNSIGYDVKYSSKLPPGDKWLNPRMQLVMVYAIRK